MKTITLPASFATALARTGAKDVECVVEVDWFPPLTESQIMANALALVYGQPYPFPNPNFITVKCPADVQVFDELWRLKELTK